MRLLFLIVFLIVLITSIKAKGGGHGGGGSSGSGGSGSGSGSGIGSSGSGTGTGTGTGTSGDGTGTTGGDGTGATGGDGTGTATGDGISGINSQLGIGTGAKAIYYVHGAYMLTWVLNSQTNHYVFGKSADCPIPYCTYGYCDTNMKQEDYSLSDGSEPLCQCGTAEQCDQVLPEAEKEGANAVVIFVGILFGIGALYCMCSCCKCNGSCCKKCCKARKS